MIQLWHVSIGRTKDLPSPVPVLDLGQICELTTLHFMVLTGVICEH